MTPGSAQPPSEDSPPVLPNHTLYRRIGRGSYGEVWLATDAMEKWRAVKVVFRRRDGSADHGYEREFKAIKRYDGICHSDASLMPILNVGRDAADRYFYYSMELADDARTGTRLAAPAATAAERQTPVEAYEPHTLRADLRQRGRLPPEECVKHGIALATALEQLHTHGLIHRDIKPDNIIFVDGHPKLADVGLVADAEGTYSLAGTTAYLSPEPERKEPGDIYALGKVLYEMANGREAEDFPAPPADFGGFSEEERTKLNEFNVAVFRACEPDLTARYATAAKLRQDLVRLELGESLLLGEKRDRAYRALKRFVRTAGPVVLVGALVLGVWLHESRMALRESLLAQARLGRKAEHLAGWSSTNWALIQHAASLRSGPDVLEQAAGALAGLDVKPLCVLSNAAGGSAAFARDGRLVVGGTMGSPALLIDTNGTKHELPVRAEGPVCWTAEGVPLQFSAPSNCCLLQEVLTGRVRQHFALAPGERVNRTVRPVLAMSLDGRRVAAAIHGGEPARVVVWDAATGHPLGEAALYVRALAFSEDGAVLAAGDTNGNVAVYSLPGMAKVLDLPPRARAMPVHCLALARDRLVRDAASSKATDWLVAAGYKGGQVVIWNLRTRPARAVCHGSLWSVTSLAFHPDGLTLASAGRNDEIRMWDVTTGAPLLRIDDAGANDTRALAFNREGTRLAWSTEASPPPPTASFWQLNPQHGLEEFPRSGVPPTVAVWELNPQRGVQVLRGLTTQGRFLCYSRDSRLVAAVSDDWQVAVWELAAGRLLNIFEVPLGAYSDSAAGAFDASGQRFAFAAGTEARLYELGTGRVLQQWRLPKAGLMDHLQWNAAGRLVLVRRGPDTEPAAERRWRVYELPMDGPPVLVHEQTETNWVPYEVALPAGGETFFVSTTSEGGPPPVIRAYALNSGQKLWQVTVPGLKESMMRPDPTGRWFAYQLDQAFHFQVVSLSGFKKLGLSPEGCLAVGPSGDEFAVDGPRGVSVCRCRGPEDRVPLGSDWPTYSTPSFSPDGKLLTWGTKQGAVLVADLQEVRRRLASLAH